MFDYRYPLELPIKHKSISFRLNGKTKVLTIQPSWSIKDIKNKVSKLFDMPPDCINDFNIFEPKTFLSINVEKCVLSNDAGLISKIHIDNPNEYIRIAVLNNLFLAVDALLDKGADINYKWTCTEGSLLDIALDKGYRDVALLLLKRGCQIKTKKERCRPYLDLRCLPTLAYSSECQIPR